MYRLIRIALVLLLSTTAALADEVTTTGGLPYPGTVTGFDNLVLKIKLRAGSTKDIPAGDIGRIDMPGLEGLTKAETILAEKSDVAAAVKAYDAALRQGGRDWQKSLIRVRRYQALAGDGRLIDQAVSAWLQIADDQASKSAAMKIAPTQFGKAGSLGNRRAIQTLEGKTGELAKDSKTNKDYLTGVMTTLADIQQANGQDEQAQATRRRLADLTGDRAPTHAAGTVRTVAVVPTAPVSRSGDRSLRLQREALAAGRVDAVIQSVETNFDRLERDSQGEAFLLLGRAMYAKAMASEPVDRKLLVKAGLYLVWVESDFAESAQAPEALYFASKVNLALGDKTGARTALERIIDQYGQVEDKTWLNLAKKDLGDLVARPE